MKIKINVVLIFLLVASLGILIYSLSGFFGTGKAPDMEHGNIDSEKEIAADSCTIESGTRADVLISAIVKLNSNDTAERISYLGQFIK